MNYAVVLSGGVGSRMRDDGFPKQYIEIKGKAVIVYTLEALERCCDVDKIVIVAASAWWNSIKSWIDHYHIKKFFEFAEPGFVRQASIFNGLKKCFADSSDAMDNVLIHDAVRPFVSETLIHRCFEALKHVDAVLPVLPVTDTTYYSEDGETITHLLERKCLFAGQAPEAFNLKKYYCINSMCTEDDFNKIKGSTEIAYSHGLQVKLIPGDYNNFKLTTPSDLERFYSCLRG